MRKWLGSFQFQGKKEKKSSFLLVWFQLHFRVLEVKMLENQEKEEEEKLAIAKDCEVEVRSEEEGFVGAWYRAILEDSPTKSRRIKLRVRYTTLLKNDCSAPLTEAVQQSFIRPVPPEDLYDGVVFVEGSVVDADLKDGWWEGVVAKKLEDEQYLVCFDTPPDILQFNRKQLRPHLDWTGSQWVRPEIKVRKKSLFLFAKVSAFVFDFACGRLYEPLLCFCFFGFWK